MMTPFEWVVGDSSKDRSHGDRAATNSSPTTALHHTTGHYQIQSCPPSLGLRISDT